MNNGLKSARGTGVLARLFELFCLAYVEIILRACLLSKLLTERVKNVHNIGINSKPEQTKSLKSLDEQYKRFLCKTT